MIQFKLNGKKIQVASSWDDLTFTQYYESFNLEGDLFKTVSLCSGIDYETLKKSNIEGIESIISAIQFIRVPHKWETPVLKCGPYDLPINNKGQFNIQYESLAQFEDSRAILSKLGSAIVGKNPVEQAKIMAASYPDVISIYLQKIRDKDYSINKAQAMIPEIWKMNAREVVTLGSFFMIKLSRLLAGIPDSSQTTPQSQKKSKLVSNGFKKSSVRSPRSRK